MVGAVLTQNTTWINVSRAIDSLKQAKLLRLDRIRSLPPDQLAQLIRPAGYYNLKARRLLNLCKFVSDNGGEGRLAEWSTSELRHALLTVNGIGPETADDILLYAFQRPVFVIDAYTRRLFSRLGVISGNEGYEKLRLKFEENLQSKHDVFNEYHALIVHHAKHVCTNSPQCGNCVLQITCITSES